MTKCDEIGCPNIKYDNWLKRDVCNSNRTRPEGCPLDEDDSTEELDPCCRPLVAYFNTYGLPTVMSCEGHNNTNMSMYWIEFGSEVDEGDIIGFMLKHPSDTFGNFASNGRFAKRLYMAVGEDGRLRPYAGWCYLAATVSAAMGDLAEWMEQDRKEG